VALLLAGCSGSTDPGDASSDPGVVLPATPSAAVDKPNQSSGGTASDGIAVAPVAPDVAKAAAPSSVSAPAAPGGSRESVVVSGLGTVLGTPDALRATFGVESRRESVTDALADASAAMTKVRDALRAGGVAAADLQTAGVNVWPVTDSNGTTITGYTATQSMDAVLRDLKSAGSLMGRAVAAGGNAARLSGVFLVISDDAALVRQARDKAFADAKAKAQQYARLAGRPLAAVAGISEQVSVPQPIAWAARDAATAGAASVPVEPGSQQVQVAVTVEWRFG
jgi:hypothetical protein